MYLSQLVVNVGHNPNRLRPGLSWIRNPYRVHQRLAMAFPSPSQLAADPFFIEPFSNEQFFGGGADSHVHVKRDDCRGFLFRIEPVHPPTILVQSAQKPNWDYAFGNADYLLARPAQIRALEPKFEAREVWRFRLCANPTVKRDGKRHGLFQEDAQVGWLRRKAETAGFAVRSVQLIPEDSQRGWKADGAVGHHMAFFSVLFEGVLEVTDPARLRAALSKGIGSGKGFGFGLLSLARAPQWTT